MAKRKTKKAEKPTKITNEQLNKLQTVVNGINKAQMQIGVFQTNIHQLLHHIAGKNDELLLMQEEIEKQYGTTDVSIIDGTISYETN
jgi:hypothetical protein